MTFHVPVMVEEALNLLQVKPGAKYIDATLGGAGHTKAILDQGGVVLGIDHDPQAIEEASRVLKDVSVDRYQLVCDNFSHLAEIVNRAKFTPVSGILFDLGTSNYQLTDPDRGFSLYSDAPLDMRMDPTLGVTAQDLVNALSKKELYELFTRLAQEKRARAIADAIVSARRTSPITTTRQLAELVAEVTFQKGRLHPATKVFLALRIAVNDERYNLKTALPQAMSLLPPGGRLVVISFHESEDRIVKQFFKDQAMTKIATLLTKKPLTPTPEEINTNPRARSAKLRALQKI